MTNLPVKKEEGFFGKIKMFFSSLFGTSKKEIVNENKEEVKEIKNSEVVTIRETLRESVNTEKEQISSMNKDSYIEELKKNPELLKNLSVDRLEKLNEYYKKVISDLETKLNGEAEFVSNIEKDDLIKEIKKNPELLHSLSIEKLEELKNYSNDRIEYLKKKIAA